MEPVKICLKCKRVLVEEKWVKIKEEAVSYFFVKYHNKVDFEAGDCGCKSAPFPPKPPA